MILELKQISKIFRSGDTELTVLRDVNFRVERGESIALLGPSGSGKSTLLQISALLDRPTSGVVIMSGVNMNNANERDRTMARREKLGFVYQSHNLLPEFTCLENVMIPLMISGNARHTAEAKAYEMLQKVGMSHRTIHYPSQMSGGEQQRVAIARALVNSPSLIIADEPTGNLDPMNSDKVFDLFLNLIQTSSTSLLMATHNVDLARRLHRAVTITDGNLVEA